MGTGFKFDSDSAGSKSDSDKRISPAPPSTYSAARAASSLKPFLHLEARVLGRGPRPGPEAPGPAEPGPRRNESVRVNPVRNPCKRRRHAGGCRRGRLPGRPAGANVPPSRPLDTGPRRAATVGRRRLLGRRALWALRRDRRDRRQGITRRAAGGRARAAGLGARCRHSACRRRKLR